MVLINLNLLRADTHKYKVLIEQTLEEQWDWNFNSLTVGQIAT